MKVTAKSFVLLLLLTSGTLISSIRTNDRTSAHERCSNSNDCQVESGLDTVANAGDVAGHNRTINEANEDGRYDMNAPPVDDVPQEREAVDANGVDIGDDDDEEDAVEELGCLDPAPEYEDDYERDAVEELGGLDPAPEHEDIREGDRRTNLAIDTVAPNGESAHVTPLPSLLSPAPRLQQERKGLYDDLCQTYDGEFCWEDAAASPSFGSGITAEGIKYSLRIAGRDARCNTEDSAAADLDSVFGNEVGRGGTEQGGLQNEVGQDLGGPGHEVGQDLGGPGHEIGQDLGGPGHEIGHDLGGPGHEIGHDLGGPGHEIGQDLGGPGHEIGHDLGGIRAPGAVAGDAVRPADVNAANPIASEGAGHAQVMNGGDGGDDDGSDDSGRAVGYGGAIAGGVPARLGVVGRVRVDIGGAPLPANNANATLEDDEDRDDNGNGSVDGAGNGRGCMRWIIFILCPLIRPGSGRGKK